MWPAERKLQSLPQDGHNNASFAFSPDGKILAGGTFDG